VVLATSEDGLQNLVHWNEYYYWFFLVL